MLIVELTIWQNIDLSGWTYVFSFIRFVLNVDLKNYIIGPVFEEHETENNSIYTKMIPYKGHTAYIQQIKTQVVVYN